MLLTHYCQQVMDAMSLYNPNYSILSWILLLVNVQFVLRQCKMLIDEFYYLKTLYLCFLVIVILIFVIPEIDIL